MHKVHIIAKSSFLFTLAAEDGDNGDGSKKKGVRAGFSIKFGGVSFNAKTLMACEEELAPLDEVIPSNADERSRWLFDIRTRPANFDVEWKAEDDSRLLCGIYQYGIGSWEAIKMDPTLNLSEKILTNDSNKKPQGKHLQSRAEYLLKIIRKNLELTKGVKGKGKKPRKQKEPKNVKSKDIVENDIASSADDEKKKKDAPPAAAIQENNNSNDKAAPHAHHPPHSNNQNHHHANQPSISHDEVSNGPTAKETVKNSTKKTKANKEQKKNKKKSEGPMHFTANNEPRALDVLGDLDPTIFNECKEKMRPVKKALKALDNPDQSLSNEDQVSHARACLISIGKQIEVCLEDYKDPDQFKEWQSNLWYFVSKFTEYDAKKLFKLYKQASKKLEGGADAKTSPSTSGKHAKDSQHAKHNDHKDKSTAADKDEKRERKEKKKLQREKERREKEEQNRHRHDDDNSNSNLDNGTGSQQHRDESAKRRLEEGELPEPETTRPYKRLHADNR